MRRTLVNLKFFTCFLFLSSFVISCVTSQPAKQSQFITAYSTSSAQPWMSDLFTCADTLNVTIKVAEEQPEIYLRIGQPEDLLSPAYQVGEEELLVVTHRESSVQNLSLAEVQALFSGLGEESAQVWVYPSELDVQGLFDQFVMQGRSVTSSARVAVNPQQMSDILNGETNSAGILPAHWKAGTVREVYSLGVFPVLAILNGEPRGVIESMVACLQSY
ncbi:MAG: hypothetical protein Fur0017_11740 [Anaerolineales bacterium]